MRFSGRTGSAARSTASLYTRLAPPARSIDHVPCLRRCQEQQHRQGQGVALMRCNFFIVPDGSVSALTSR
jgi:hypothetical protein